jgi:hypothetical protein
VAETAEVRSLVNPAAPLKDVYSVALGVALVLAVEQIVDIHREGAPFAFDLFPVFFAFALTAFPLYHWAVRVVDRAYLESSSERPRKAILTDLLLGSTEILLLIALSILITRPGVFLVGLTALLGFEVAAGAAFTYSRGYEGFESDARRYTLLNALAFATALVTVAGIEILSLNESATTSAWIGFAIASARTAAVYRVEFDFLFSPSPRS